VVFHAGPSDVITRNFVSGSRSPTLMGMILVLSLTGERLLFSPGRAARRLRGRARRRPKLARPAN
jgi:hypothetical protein